MHVLHTVKHILQKLVELHQKKDRIGERTRRTEDPIGDLFGRVEKQATAMLHKAPKDAKLPTGPSGKEQVDPRWVKDQLTSSHHVESMIWSPS